MVVVTVLGRVPNMLRTYSLTDCTTDLILDYSLVDVSETGSSVAMEKEGLKKSLDKLLN